MQRSVLGQAGDRGRWMIVAVLATIIASFVGTTIHHIFSERGLDSRFAVIRELTTVSVERLAQINAAMLESERALSAHLHPAETNHAEARQRLEASLDRFQEQVRGYLTLEMLPGERVHWLAVQESSARFHEAVRTTYRLADQGKRAEARDMLSQSVVPAAAQVTSATMGGLGYDVGLGRKIASEGQEAVERTRWVTLGLTAFCTLLGAFGGWLVRRQARARRALVAAHTEMLEARTAELEMFAGRVAHDIRNPLSAARLSTELIQRMVSDHALHELTAVSLRALSRAEAITSGLLQFARAGARNPDPGARSSVRGVLEDVSTGMAPDAARVRVEIQTEEIPPVRIACSSGVYMSIVGNLVRNAIKYMGNSATRRVVLRVIDKGSMVRTEVVDTGPGIEEAMLPSLFQPYFRANSGPQEGLGLGLATVKRLVEGHGGRVGASSQPGKGSTFWFELPHGGSDSDESTDVHPSSIKESSMHH